jgi:Xaa-Pro dipeptidase
MLAQSVDTSKSLGVDKNLSARFLLPLMDAGAGMSFVNASACVDRVRSCKDGAERRSMREASRLNDAGMAEFIKAIRPDMTEQELAAGMDATYRALGADDCSFTPLVGFGKNAAVGHHEPDGTRLKEGDCVLLDIGCKKGNYCADMTRTFFYRSVPEKHREVYEIVRRANVAAEVIIKPGVKFYEIDHAARSVIEKAGYGKNFTHRLGHSIGIEVHESSDVSSTNTDEVKSGMTFSIEPGIYLEGEAGVRIEDLVLVTEDGYEVLNQFSKELQIIE